MRTMYCLMRGQDRSCESRVHRSWTLIFVFCILVFLLMSGCQKEGSPAAELEMLEPIEVELIVPDVNTEVKASETVRLEAIVTQQDEYIEDADDVQFEISLEGSSGLELTATYEGEGKYIADYQFPVAGVYKVTSHVTARGMHTMPSKQVNVVK